MRGFKCRKLAKFDFVSDLILYFHYILHVLPLVNIIVFYFLFFFSTLPPASAFNLCAPGVCGACDMTRLTHKNPPTHIRNSRSSAALSPGRT